MRALPLVGFLLFTSGACALVYQSVWLRAFRLMFGASTPSTAAVLAIFLGGLGLGAALLARRAERTARPLVLYGTLELGVAVSAALTPLLLRGAELTYAALGGTPALGVTGATLLRLVLSALVLGVPVVLMGGTLPAAARAVTGADDSARRALAALYGVNTLGAVAGTVGATFALLEIYGAQLTLWLACLANAAIGVVARSAGRSVERLPRADDAAAGAKARRRGWVLAAAFVTGFVFLLAELVWYRMTAPILGGSTWGFGLVLAFALAGVGIGGALYAAAPPRVATAAAFALTCALEALALLVPFAIGDELALLAHALRGWGAASFPVLVTGWSVVTAVIVLPAALVAGYQFPLLLALKGSSDVEVGRDSGEVYAANTAGSIVGSLAGGFVLLPALGAVTLWWGAAAALAVLSLAALGIGFFLQKPRAGRAATAAVVITLLAALWCSAARGPGPLWRHSGIGAGRAALDTSSPNLRIAVERDLSRAVLHEEDGRESSIAVTAGHGFSLIQNGKSDGNTLGDAPTQIGLALLPAVLGADVKRAFVIGLGTGQSAGWLAQVPGVDTVHVAEIEPAVVAFAERVADTNFDVVNNPRVTVQIGDGRELLSLAADRFDLIVSEPSNPYRAGVSSFFSAEFYRAAARHLTPQGAFAQWVQGYEIDAGGLEIVAATLSTAFSTVTVWEVGPRDLLFLASNAPQQIDVARLRARLTTEPYQRWARRVVGIDDAEGVLALHLAGARTVAAVARAAAGLVHTDDAPLLEYAFARTVGVIHAPARALVHDAAQRLSDSRPQLDAASAATVQWPTVDARNARMHLWVEHASTSAPPPVPPIVQTLIGGDAAAGAALINAPDTPLDLPLKTLVASAMAAAGQGVASREQLLALLADIEAHSPVDGGWIRLHAAVVDRADAAALDQLLTQAAERARADPWGAPRVLRKALLAVGGALVDVDSRPLLTPFAGDAERALRLWTAFDLERRAALRAGTPRASCVDVFAAFEPAAAWTEVSLELRARCYAAHRAELAAPAAADLAAFRLAAPRPQLAVDGGG